MPSEQGILTQEGGFDFCEGPEKPGCSRAQGWESLREEPVSGQSHFRSRSHTALKEGSRSLWGSHAYPRVVSCEW